MFNSSAGRALDRARHYFDLFWRETRTYPLVMAVLIGIWLMAVIVVMIQALG